MEVPFGLRLQVFYAAEQTTYSFLVGDLANTKDAQINVIGLSKRQA
jgi:hypothetical protein